MQRTPLWTTAGMLALLAAPLLTAPQSLSATTQQEEEEDGCGCRPLNLGFRGDLPAVIMSGFSRARIGIALGGPEQDEYDDVGAYVRSVTEEGPAASAGLQDGDVITHVDGQSLLDPLSGSMERRVDEDGSLPVGRLMALASRWDEGDEVEITYERDGTSRSVTVIPEEMDFDFDFGAMDGRLDDLSERLRVLTPRLRDGGRGFGRAPMVRFRSGDGDFRFGMFGFRGMELRALDSDLGRYFGSDVGVLVLRVGDDAELPLLAGDVILEIDGREVEEPTDVHRIMSSYDRDEVARLTILRDGERMEIESVPDR